MPSIPVYSPESVGRRIRFIREAFGWSQPQLGEICGVRKNAVSNWENGRQKPTIAQMSPLVQDHGLTLDFIYLGRWETLRADVAAKLGLLTAPQIDQGV